jgi:hypothetical protein
LVLDRTDQTAAGSWTSGGDFYSVSGAANGVGTSGATFYITGVQFEKGSLATSFETLHYGQELALCQRYYEIYRLCDFYAGISYGNYVFLSYPFHTTKRAAPTMSASGTTYSSNGTGGVGFTANVFRSTVDAFSIGANNFTTFTGFTDGFVYATAEL